MFRLSKMRLLASVALVSLAALAATSVATADTQTGMQDPNATVTASLLSSNSLDPNIARVGETVSARVSVESTMFETSYVNVYIIADLAGTRLTLSKDKLMKLKPGRTWEWGANVRIQNDTPAGTYSLRVIAFTPFGFIDGSSATATIQVVR